jgi:hypothetical protein
MKAAFVGSGGLGGQRYAGAMGQALGDVQANLLGKQADVMSAGYKSALDAAFKQKQAENAAAQTLQNIGTAEGTATTAAQKALGDIGTQQLAYEQSKIEAPLTRAANVAAIMRGYTYPTTTTETYKGPASAYQPSPLSQLAGLGTLIGSGFNTPGGWGNQLLSGLKTFFGATSSSDDQLMKDILDALRGPQYNYSGSNTNPVDNSDLSSGGFTGP